MSVRLVREYETAIAIVAMQSSSATTPTTTTIYNGTLDASLTIRIDEDGNDGDDDVTALFDDIIVSNVSDGKANDDDDDETPDVSESIEDFDIDNDDDSVDDDEDDGDRLVVYCNATMLGDRSQSS